MARASDTIRLCIDAACARQGYTNYTLEHYPGLTFFKLRFGNPIAQAGANIFYYSPPQLQVMRIGLGDRVGQTDILNANHPGFIRDLAAAIYLPLRFQEAVFDYTQKKLKQELDRLHRKSDRLPDFDFTKSKCLIS